MEQKIIEILSNFGVKSDKIFFTNSRKINWNVFTHRVDIEPNSQTVGLTTSTKMILNNHFSEKFVEYLNGSSGIILYNDIDFIENGDNKIMVLSYVFVPPFIDGVSNIHTKDTIYEFNRYQYDKHIANNNMGD